MSISTASAHRPPLLALLSSWIFSSIGKKTIVALTGIVLTGFVVGHMCGNLTFFFGQDMINGYAMHLEDLGIFLWFIRIFLLATLTCHIYFTMLLWKENAAARPTKYKFRTTIQSTVFSRTMRLTGLILFAFIAFHIAHFTARIIDPQYNSYLAALPDGHEVRNVFKMMVAGFSNPIVSGFYVLSMGLLAFHLSHGIASLFQTLGLANQALLPRFKILGRIIALLLFIGFSAIPISVVVFGYGKSVLN